MKNLKLETKSVAELNAIYTQLTGKAGTFTETAAAIKSITNSRLRGHQIAKALLDKTVEKGCTEGEESAAVEKLEAVIKKYSLDPMNYTIPLEVLARLKAREDAIDAKNEGTNSKGEPAKEEPKKEASKEEPKKEAPKKSGRIIRVACEELLMKVDFIGEADNKKYGLSYADILAKIKEEFPNAKTSLACLRWYAVQLRDRGENVPERPRAQKKAA